MNAADAADEAEILARECFPLLAGRNKMVQSAALCELVALHLSGHVILGDPEETAKLRASLLDEFFQAVKDLIPILDRGVIQPEIARRQQ
jgi:hypothetical protein